MNLFWHELRRVIPSLLGRRYVLCIENDRNPDYHVSRVIKHPVRKHLRTKGMFRYRMETEHEYRAKVSDRMYELPTTGVLGNVTYGGDPGWHWKPFCPFGIGKNFPLFTEYLAKQLTD